MDIDSAPNVPPNLNLRCDDCDEQLVRSDAMSLDDGLVAEETACHVCRRQVCDGCAVLGDDRVCLSCAVMR
jgi:hypothetical protein